jgi:lipoprotein signal peptidase
MTFKQEGKSPWLRCWKNTDRRWLLIQISALWPVFDVADSSIFLGITFILIFQKRFFQEEHEETLPKEAEAGE